MGRYADVRAVADGDDVELFVGGCVGVSAALTEDEAVRDIGPAVIGVGVDPNADLVGARGAVDAELEVARIEDAVAVEDVVEQIGERAPPFLCGFEVGV